ncbi:MAG: glutamyl-tRNA reductase [Acidobacteriota bacterium]
MNSSPEVVQVGIDHRTVRLGMLERLQVARQRCGTVELRPRCSGVVRLATCHRLELYLEGASDELAVRLFAQWLGRACEGEGELAPHLVVRTGAAAGEHLLRVATGLESAVLGEDQIQGQVREAYRQACAAREAGPLLHRLFHAAFRAGKRVRAETPLKQGGRSLAGNGVSWLGRQLGEFAGATVLVIGAGEMARIAAARLRARGVRRLLITNRTWSRGDELAREVGGETLPWAWRGRALSEVDGIVCASGASEPVIPAAWLSAAVAAPGRRLAVVDLAVPRNIEAPAVAPPGLALADVEELSRQLSQDAVRRAGAIGAAERIVGEELSEWLTWAQARVRGAVRSSPARGGMFAG